MSRFAQTPAWIRRSIVLLLTILAALTGSGCSSDAERDSALNSAREAAFKFHDNLKRGRYEQA
jgi:hypothetical protein